MKTDQIVMCVVALLLGMLLANMLQNVCGCKVVEGLEGEEGEGRCQPENWGCGENAGAGPGEPTTPNLCVGMIGEKKGTCRESWNVGTSCNCSGAGATMTASPPQAAATVTATDAAAVGSDPMHKKGPQLNESNLEAALALLPVT